MRYAAALVPRYGVDFAGARITDIFEDTIITYYFPILTCDVYGCFIPLAELLMKNEHVIPLFEKLSKEHETLKELDVSRNNFHVL